MWENNSCKYALSPALLLKTRQLDILCAPSFLNEISAKWMEIFTDSFILKKGCFVAVVV